MSNTLTIADRDMIAKNEAEMVYDPKIKKAEKKFIKALEDAVKEIVKSRFTVSDELLHSGYIRTSNYAQYKCLDVLDRYSKMKNFSLNQSYPQYVNRDSFEIKSTEELDKLRAEWIEITEQKEKFKKELKAVLVTYRNKKKLIEDIPEFRDYFKGEVVMSTALVPIEKINQIRSKLIGFDAKKKDQENV